MTLLNYLWSNGNLLVDSPLNLEFARIRQLTDIRARPAGQDLKLTQPHLITNRA